MQVGQPTMQVSQHLGIISHEARTQSGQQLVSGGKQIEKWKLTFERGAYVARHVNNVRDANFLHERQVLSLRSVSDKKTALDDLEQSPELSLERELGSVGTTAMRQRSRTYSLKFRAV